MPKITGKRVTVTLTVSPECRQLFTTTEFFVEYEEELAEVPTSILMVPFFYNLLPICWFKNIELEVPVLDQQVVATLATLKQNMSEIHGNTLLQGKVTIGSIENNSRTVSLAKSAMLFSGGVDSWGSFLSHYKESPILCTVWGADIKLKDKQGWNRVKQNTLAVCQHFETEAFFVKTNFRDIMNYFYIEEGLAAILTGNWWHDVQHGMGLTSLFAPLMYQHGVTLLYVPGTFSSQWLEPIASEPRIDNHIQFGFSSVFHDQFDKNRQEKLLVVRDYYAETKQPFTIRVCYEGSGGTNCCVCEKCNRTMIGLMALGLDTQAFGFQTTNLKLIKKSLANTSWVYSQARKLSFQDIQKTIQLDHLSDNQDFLEWFKAVDFDERYQKNQTQFFRRWKKNSKRMIKTLLKKS